MNRTKLRVIKFCFICIIVTQLIFLGSLVFFYNTILPEFSFFYVMPYEDWTWFLQQPTVPYRMIVDSLFSALRHAVFIVNAIGLYQLYFSKRNYCNVRKRLKVMIPLIALLAYLPCFYYIKYQAAHFRQFMAFVPAEFLSLILLGLIIADRDRTQKTKRRICD